MAAYAFASASFGNWVALQTALQSDIPVAYSQVDDSSARSTASATYSTLQTTSVTVSADEIVFGICNIQTSNSTNAAKSEFRFVMNATNTQGLIVREMTGSTDGSSHIPVMFGCLQDTSGSINVKIEYRANSGTVYVPYSRILVFRFKRR